MIRLVGTLTIRVPELLSKATPQERGLTLLPAKTGTGKRWQRTNPLPPSSSSSRGLAGAGSAAGAAPGAGSAGAAGTGGADGYKVRQPEWGDLPKKPRQKVDTREALHSHATAAQAIQVKTLNEGQGLDREIGATVVRLDKAKDEGAIERALRSPGPVIIIGGMKSLAEGSRAEQKVTTKYGGDWSRLTDVVRATVAVDTMDELDALIPKLAALGIKPVSAPDDRFAQPLESGYRDLNWNVEYGGHVGELQIHVKPMLVAKQLDGGHHLYEEARSIEADHGKETERWAKAPPDVMARYTKLLSDMRTLYGTAWTKATKKEAMAKALARSDSVGYGGNGATMFPKFYRMKGDPVIVMSKDHLPTDWMGDRVDLWEFAHNAMPITKAEYDELVADLPKPSKAPPLHGS